MASDPNSDPRAGTAARLLGDLEDQAIETDRVVLADRAVGALEEDLVEGSVGVVTKLIGKATFDPEDAVVMVCGPEVMMRFTVLELLRKGVDPGNLYMSMERNMECGIGLCGHCQFGSRFVCKDGPVFRYSDIRDLLSRWEI